MGHLRLGCRGHLHLQGFQTPLISDGHTPTHRRAAPAGLKGLLITKQRTEHGKEAVGSARRSWREDVINKYDPNALYKL